MSNKPNRGFTLVEMLVATGLVVLMMLMFAQIFRTAGGLVSNQKGMAELDQSVRTMTILLQGDMKSRTFRDVTPFHAGQDTDSTSGTFGPNYSPERRKGFFSISENDPASATDDVLHLTITSMPLTEEPAAEISLPYSARAKLMYNGTAPTDPNAYLLANPDQPEFDDGQLSVNNTGSSKYAEVCWFLRNGNLYRRVLLVRDPYNRDGHTTSEPQDSSATPTEFIATTYAGEEHVNATTNPNGVFWRDFDYAAYADAGGMQFHSAPESLDNLSTSPAVVAGFPQSLGVPFLRFGSSVSRVSGTSPNYRIFGPREFLTGTDPATYIGRYTIEETTHADFAYPGNFTAATDPFNTGGPALTLSNGTVQEYRYDGSDQNQRRGEDLVMSNVHSFDIQVWDDVLNRFANLGHSETTQITDPDGSVHTVEGWYHQNKQLNADFGNRYDTWHPFGEMPASPPYSPFGTNRADSRTAVDRTTVANAGLGSDLEVPLRAVQILVRFYDPGSESMRDLTFTFSLN